jgi:hypothetical protein
VVQLDKIGQVNLAIFEDRLTKSFEMLDEILTHAFDGNLIYGEDRATVCGVFDDEVMKGAVLGCVFENWVLLFHDLCYHIVEFHQVPSMRHSKYLR